MVKDSKRRFNSSFSLWENQFTLRYGASRIGASVHINRFFSNFLAVCINNGFSYNVYLEKLYKEHGIKISIGRVKELAGMGRYAGRAYKGFVNYEWLYAISVFCGYDLIIMLTEEFSINDRVKDSVTHYWAGYGKGARAGAVDLTRNSFPEAINYVVKR